MYKNMFTLPSWIYIFNFNIEHSRIAFLLELPLHLNNDT